MAAGTSDSGERGADGMGLLGEGLGPWELSGSLHLSGRGGLDVAGAEGRLCRGLPPPGPILVLSLRSQHHVAGEAEAKT